MVEQQIFFHPTLLLLFLDPGSGMDKISRSGINIPDPPHWVLGTGTGYRVSVCQNFYYALLFAWYLSIMWHFLIWNNFYRF